MVRVRLYGSARQLAGREELELAMPAASTVAELLRRIAADPERVPAALASAILINGRNCAFQQGTATAISDGDLVEILPIVTGG
jgi:molybdopterin converting factor small subunit